MWPGKLARGGDVIGAAWATQGKWLTRSTTAAWQIRQSTPQRRVTQSRAEPRRSECGLASPHAELVGSPLVARTAPSSSLRRASLLGHIQVSSLHPPFV